MNANNIKANLDQLWRSFHSILESDSADVIEKAKAKLDKSKRDYDAFSRRTDNPRLVAKPWGYEITPQKPLRFRISTPSDGFDAQIDLFCRVLWEKEEQPPVTQEIGLRLWNMESCYREDWDSPSVFEHLNQSSSYGRVMLRCHFDLANPKQSGPKYHLQFGGNPHANELAWFPENINLPRFTHAPMDLVLVCQLVAANFFPEIYKTEILKDPEWKYILTASQRHLLESYYSSCLEQIREDKILLNHLWNK